MLPGVNIEFKNGQLGSVTPSEDGASAMVFANKWSEDETGTTGTLCLVGYNADVTTWRNWDDVVDYAGESGKEEIEMMIKSFYECGAPSGTPLYISILSVSSNSSVTADGLYEAAYLLAVSAKGEIRQLCIMADSDLSLTERIALAKRIRKSSVEYYSPMLVLTSASDSEIDDADELSDADGVVVGLWEPAVLILSRLAAIPVERNIGRVRDGALPLDVFCSIIGALYEEFELSLSMLAVQAETYNDKNVVGITKYVGKSGFYFTDDPTATVSTDDYHSIARRRVADKAYRVAYQTLADYVNDNLPVTSSGTLSAPAAKAIEQTLISAIYNRMTAEGNLSVDSSDPSDMGVQVHVDTENDFVATSTINVTMLIKPYGYAKYIKVELGFLKE